MQLEALHKLSYGMYIVSSINGEKNNGQIANTVFQITSEPAQIAVSINRQNFTHEFISSSKVFSVSILDQNTPMTLIGRFGFKSGRTVDKFNEVKFTKGKTGSPLVTDNTIGAIECEVVNSIDCGTHTIFIGKVVDANIIASGEPMTYAYYHEVKKGLSPKTAPTYQGGNKNG
jgi:ferric-chelate reductase [NAD(P)H]